MSAPRIAVEVAPQTPEPFVSADEAAKFLSVSRRYLLALARRGLSGAYALGTGTCRKIWVFRLSELAAAIAGRTRP
jgi:excisionase family DNA binding protein